MTTTTTTPLLEAVKGKHKDAVRLLLEHRASPNICDRSTNIPLIHIAAHTGCNDMVKALLEHGANPNMITCCSRTSLKSMYFVKGDGDMERLVESYGGLDTAFVGYQTLCFKCTGQWLDEYGNCSDYSDDSSDY